MTLQHDHAAEETRSTTIAPSAGLPESGSPERDGQALPGDVTASRVAGLRAEVAAALLCAGVGLVLAIAPHVTMLARYGALAFLADGDDVLYLAIGRIPYHGALALRDPFCGPWEARPTLYSWMQFVPLGILARWLSIDPLLMPLLWRAIGGPLLGLTVYFLLRRVLAGTRHPTAWALGCAMIALADTGFCSGQTLYGLQDLVRGLIRGELPLPTPNALGQYRVVTPLLNLPALLVLVGVLAPPAAGERRGWTALIGGVLMLGLCVQLYFFFWTAAVLAIAVILAARAVSLVRGWGGERARRARTEIVFGTSILAGGLLLGAPQVLDNARAFRAPELKPILHRLSRGQVLPPGHAARVRYVKNYTVLSKLAFGAAVIVGLGAAAWRLIPVWVVTAAGYVLANSAIVTGLEFENFHWAYVHGPLGEVLALAGLALVIDRLTADSTVWTGRLGWLWAVPVGLSLMALVWRPYEVMRCPITVEHNRVLRALEPLRPALARLGPSDILAGPREANVAALFGFGGQLYQYDHTLCSSVTSDEEVHERHALNAWLQGMSLEEYLKVAGRDKFPVGEVLEPGWQPDAVTSARAAIFRDLLAGRSAALLARYRPNYLLRPSAAGPPPPDRGGPWVRVEAGGEWAFWERGPERIGLKSREFPRVFSGWATSPNG
jgi:hypothetical protein